MNIPASITSRKGARSPKEVPVAVLQLLNTGKMSTVNLSEWLAIDQRLLLQQVLSDIGQRDLIPEFLDTINGLKKQTATQVIKAIGQLINDSELLSDKDSLISQLSAHLSDTVRCWAAYARGLDPSLSTFDRFNVIKPYAADAHFGVREIAWMAARDTIIADLDVSLELLTKWALSEDENVRRFASEATRPRGVWSSHINTLKDNPELAIKVLAPLQSDASKYVRDSVGNWLNDASKTRPEWVIQVCDKWTAESDTTETKYIVKKARRTIDKK